MHDPASINWRSRGYLPHADAPGMHQHVIFNLADALRGVTIIGEGDAHRQAFDDALDRGLGGCLLARPECAASVQNELLRLDGERYRLLAWCVMPNHVHVVIDQMLDLPGTVRRWKSWMAKEINTITGRSGAVWQKEYFDRFARDEHHLATMIDYVEQNPVVAGLVTSSVDWPWSSASHRDRAGLGPGAPG
jgi:REP element-mobilizing transposase RayT